ncbi:MAG: creatininase family protein [Fusicatenibacter sp.]
MKHDYECLCQTMMGMTYEEVETAVLRDAVVLFPIGVVEAHGPHLPLGTDLFTSLNQALEIKRYFDREGRACIVAPPFYFGGTKAMTRQFAGTFTSSKETIVSAVKDILASLDRFGFSKTVFLNAHGDDLQRTAMLQALIESNQVLKMRSYWPEYADDIEYLGFTGEEDYLLKITPMQLDEAFEIEKWPEDEFDIHAAAFETALMTDICPDMIRTEKIEELSPTFLTGDEQWKWNEGNAVDIALIPRAYVGDPQGCKFIHAHMDRVYEAYAKSLMELL